MSGTKAIKVGLLGLGNIGAGTVEILRRNGALIERRLGVPFELARAADLDPARAARLELGAGRVHHRRPGRGGGPVDPGGGGADRRDRAGAQPDPRTPWTTASTWSPPTRRSSPRTGASSSRAAEARRVSLGFEGAVAGGIPLIHTIRRGLVANRIRRVAGIINGTCNYILTRMARERRRLPGVLADAQAHGLRRGDPALDVDGIDAAHKLAILADLCFDASVPPDAIARCGITQVTPLDLTTAEELGYRVKLLCSAAGEDGQLEAWVHPALVPVDHPLAAVDGVFNAVYLEDDNLGPSLYFGRGAGALPTGSAVMADVVSAARDILSGAVSRMPASGARIRRQVPFRLRPAGEARSEFYLRVTALDRPGVLSAVTGVIGRHGVSIASVIQRGRGDVHEEAVPILIVTHEATFAEMSAALGELDAHAAVKGAGLPGAHDPGDDLTGAAPPPRRRSRRGPTPAARGP